MIRHIVAAFRMSPAGMSSGPRGTYLPRARSLCARGEALGGRLVAWGAALVAIAWDEDSLEEAILLVTGNRDEPAPPEQAWACGLAEGEIEALALDGARMQLAWGEALLVAASLARVAKPGEVLVDADVRALRGGQLALHGARAASDSGQRVRGWKLDLAHPWRRHGEPSLDAGATLETAAPTFTHDELSTAEVLQIVEAVAPSSETSRGPGSREPGSRLAERVRLVQQSDDGVEALAQLRRLRADAETGTAAAKCQASLALAMALAVSGRPEEGLLEALDALARAREGSDTKAAAACLALLAKLYSGAGRPGEAAALREAAGVG